MLRQAPTLMLVLIALMLPVAFAGIVDGVLLAAPTDKRISSFLVVHWGRNLSVPLALVASFALLRGALIGRTGLSFVVLVIEALAGPPLLVPLAFAGFAFMDAPRIPTQLLFGTVVLLPAAFAEVAIKPLRRQTPLAWLGHLCAGALAGWLTGRTSQGWMEYWWEPAIVGLATVPYVIVLMPVIQRLGSSPVAAVGRAGVWSLVLTWAFLGVFWMGTGAPAASVALLPLRIVELHVPRSVREARYQALNHPEPGAPLRLGQGAYAFAPKQIKTLNVSYSERLPDRYSEIVLEVPLTELLDDRRQEGSVMLFLQTRPSTEVFDPCGPPHAGPRCQYSFPHRDLTIMYFYDGRRAKPPELTPAIVRFIEAHRRADP